MLEEAIQVIRALWKGEDTAIAAATTPSRTPGSTSLPEAAPADLRGGEWREGGRAGRPGGDGLVSTAPKAELVKTFEQAGGKGKPRYAELTVCWAADEAAARKTAHEIWPMVGIGGELSQELPLPRHFEQAAETVREEDVAEDGRRAAQTPRSTSAALKEYVDAGFDHVAMHQIGPDQEGFFRFYEREVLPSFR